VTVYNKIGGRLEIPVMRSLIIENVIFDSSDSNVDFDDSSTCLEDKTVCCTQTDLEDGTCSLLIQPTEVCEFAVGTSIINFNLHSQTVLEKP